MPDDTNMVHPSIKGIYHHWPMFLELVKSKDDLTGSSSGATYARDHLCMMVGAMMARAAMGDTNAKEWVKQSWELLLSKGVRLAPLETFRDNVSDEGMDSAIQDFGGDGLCMLNPEHVWSLNVDF